MSQKRSAVSNKTFKEYCMSFINIKDQQLDNEWGWFIDIELNYHPTVFKKSSQYVSIPKTIQEYPSIRSMKSINNLYHTSIEFEINKNKYKPNNLSKIITHTFGLIGIVLCYYITSKSL